jgi:hypothetical protein
MWKGTLGGPSFNQGKVQFQFAASDSESGPWNFVGGNGCGAGEWYDPGAASIPLEIQCFSQLNNKRYLKYKVRICSSDCTNGGDYTPTVNDIVVSWSP